MDERQMNMASEQRTERYRSGPDKYDFDIGSEYTVRLRWVRPLQRRSAVRHLLRPIPARVRRKEVVTR